MFYHPMSHWYLFMGNGASLFCLTIIMFVAFVIYKLIKSEKIPASSKPIINRALSIQAPQTNRIPITYGASRFSLSLDYQLPKIAALKRPFLIMAFAFLILCSLSISQPSIRPETGTIIKDIARNGYGVLTIRNNWTMDTVGVLTDDNLKPLMAVYIRSNDSFKFEKIDDGSYGLYFTIGNNWDENTKKFSDLLGYYRYNPSLIFQTTQNDTDIEYSVFELDLYEAESSNFVPEVFDFPDLR